jgi:glc operon protein GlcG
MDGRSIVPFVIAIMTMMTLRADVAACAQDREPNRFLDPSARGSSLPPPELTTVPSDVRDRAGLFTTEAARTAREALVKIEKTAGVPVLIETIATLEGRSIDEEATRLARRSGTQGIFILIARKETKIEVLVSRRYAEALPRQARNDVRSTFIESFRKREFDEGLRKGIEALRVRVTAARQEGHVPPAEKPATHDDTARPPLLPDGALAAAKDGKADGVGLATSPTGPSQNHPLLLRNQARLTLEGARTIIAAAAKEATALNLKVNIAVVDDGGHLLSFDRMDGAQPASGDTAITKATTAATSRQPSGVKLTTPNGGVPVVVDGQVIGGVGVGGGTGEQDAQVARAGAQALVEATPKP